MNVTILQLNMWAGTLFSSLREFLENNSFDILCFQEVAGKGAKHGNVDCTIDCFEELKKILQATHFGELAISQYASSNPETGYFGNAIFYKKNFLCLNKHILPLFKRNTPFPSESLTFEEVGRNALHLTLQRDNTIFDIVTAHLALAKDPKSKIEESSQRQQNIKLVKYIKELKNKFILTGDFNIQSGQPTVNELEEIAVDLTKKFHVINTIDPTVHRAWERIKPGFSIDYLFVSSEISVLNFTVLEDIHISDHLGLCATLNI
jgi:endonuclease/exonuclease/phosphatase family metal-dependent hydrolase